MRLADIMSTDVETVTPDLPAEDAMARMKRRRIHHLVVADRGAIVGVVSSRDLALRLAAWPGTARVGDLMTPHVVTAPGRTTIREAARKLRGGSIGCLPIVEFKRLVGIVTLSDLLTLLGEGPVPRVRRTDRAGARP